MLCTHTLARTAIVAGAGTARAREGLFVYCARILRSLLIRSLNTQHTHKRVRDDVRRHTGALSCARARVREIEREKERADTERGVQSYRKAARSLILSSTTEAYCC